MALDTRDRRASAVHVGLPWRGLLPLPDVGAEDQGDRQQAAGYYRGILAALLGINDIPFLALTAITAAYPQGASLVVARAGVGDVTAAYPQGASLVAQGDFT